VTVRPFIGEVSSQNKLVNNLDETKKIICHWDDQGLNWGVAKSDLEKVSPPPLEKCVGHTLKLLDTV